MWKQPPNELSVALSVGFVNSGYQVRAELKRLFSAIDRHYQNDPLIDLSIDIALLQMEAAARLWTLRVGDPAQAATYFAMMSGRLENAGIPVGIPFKTGDTLADVQSCAYEIAIATDRYQEAVLSRRASSPVEILGATFSILCAQHAAFSRVFQISRERGSVMVMEARYFGCLAEVQRIIGRRHVARK